MVTDRFFARWNRFTVDHRSPVRILLCVLIMACIAFDVWAGAGPDGNAPGTQPNEPATCPDCPDPNSIQSEECADTGPAPIYFKNGAVIESVTDVSLPGVTLGWSHSRKYSSDHYAADPTNKPLASINGSRWEVSAFTAFLAIDGATSDVDIYVDPTSKRTFTEDSGNYTGPKDFKGTLEHVGANTEYVLTMVDAGLVYRFHDSSHATNKDGMLKSITDLYGNETITFTFATGTGGNTGRLTEVTTTQGWTVKYTYRTATTIPGTIEKIEVKNGSGTVVQQVDYTYQEGSSSPYTEHDDVGTTGDLAQVKVTRRDAGGSLTSERYTQYRYFADGRLKMVLEPNIVAYIVDTDGTIADADAILEKADDDAVAGSTVEDLASRTFEYYDGSDAAHDPPDTSQQVTTPWGAENLQTTYGGSDVSETIDATSGSYMVKSETVRGTGSGGCCGGSTGVTKTYFYMDLNGGSSTDANEVIRIVVEDTEDGSSGEVYRTVYGLNDDGVLLRKAFTNDPTPAAGSAKYWLDSWVLGAASGNSMNQITEKRMPSAHTEADTDAEVKKFLDPLAPDGMSTNDSTTLNDSTGIVMTYTYDTNGRRTETKIKQGENGTEYFLSATDYGDGTTANKPAHLPVATYSFPTQETVKTNGKKTTLAYTFWGSASAGEETQIKTVTTTLPTVATSQNGSNTAITMRQYFDSSGRLRWSKDGNDNITYYAYHPDTGGLAYMMQNVETDDLPVDITAGSSGKWIEWNDEDPMAPGDDIPSGFGNPNDMADDALRLKTEDDDNLQLATKTEFDDQGRVTRTEDAGGTVTFTVYEDNRTLVFPAFDTATDQPLLPIQATVVDDGGQLIEQYTVDPARTAATNDVPTGLTAGTDQSHYLSWTKYSYDTAGRLEQTDRYHDIPATGAGTLSTNFYRTVLQYDDQGRREYTIQVVSGTNTATGVEQVTKLSYDVLGRVVKVEQGVSSAASDMGATYSTTYPTLETISETFYDGATDVTVPVVGDGLVTKRHGYYGTGANDYIAVENHYNWRNQLRGVEAPAAPYTVQDVDWMGRVVAVAQYDTEPTWGTVTGDEDYAESIATDRMALSTIEYDDLGRVYQRAVHSIDADDGSDDGKLVTDNYYDANSNLVATETAGAGGTELAYDGADRQYQTRVVTALEATKYAAGAYQYRAPVPDPTLTDMTGGDDEIVQIAHSAFDDSGNVIESYNLEINHDDTTNVGLDVSNDDDYVQTAVYSWYDNADRVTETANYGTSTTKWEYAAATARPATAPATSDTILVTAFTYDTAGRLYTVTDPKAKVSRTFYDDLGRTVYTVENYVNFNESTEANTGGGTDNDEDRVTKYVYNGLGRLTNQIAMDADADGSLVDDPGGNQDTVYLYEDAVSAARVTNIIYPDSSDTDSTGTDQVKIAYHVDGSIDTRTDQRGNVITHHYDSLRRLKAQVVTTLDADTDGSVRSITRKYDSLSRLSKITSHGDQNSDPDDTTDVENQVVFEFTDFGQLKTEYQEHDGVKDGNTHSLVYHYDEDKTGTDFNNALRLKRVDYPNARQIHYTYAPGSVDDKLSRIAAVNYEHATTADTAGDPIASYSYNGVGRVVRKDLAEPDIRLDYFDDSAAGEYAGFDRFGRVIGQQWEDYSGMTDADVWHAKHGYDRASNREYSERQVYGAYSQLFAHDNLHRLKSMLSGTLKDDQSEIIGIFESKSVQTLDALGNALTNTVQGVGSTHTPNDANEYTARVTPGDIGNGKDLGYEFSDSTESSDFEAIEDTTFDVDDSGNDALRITALDADLADWGNAGIVLVGEAHGLAGIRYDFPQFPGSTGEAGFVFGYKSREDYWLLLYNKADDKSRLYHVVSGARTQKGSTVNGTARYIYPRNGLLESNGSFSYEFAEGFPSGRFGFYSDTTDVKFVMLRGYNMLAGTMTDRWMTFSKSVVMNTTDDVLKTDSFGGEGTHLQPALLRGVRVGGGGSAGAFEATFSLAPGSGSGQRAGFVFNAQTYDDFDVVGVQGGASAPFGQEVVDGGNESTLTPASSSAVPALGAGEVYWYRITYDGTKVTVKCQVAASEPSEASWSGATVYWTEDDTGDPFRHRGGMVGFYAHYSRTEIDHFTLKADRNGDGDFADAGETVAYDDFTLDGSGDRDAEPEHDASGNLTYDGVHEYVYDAWNRLVVVEDTHVDSGGTKQVGLATATYEYDGLHRRIVRAVTNSADLDCTYHDYYDGQSVVEVRNGSDEVLKQQVWGVTYIDELVQVSINDDPADGTEDDTETNYFTLHNANYNVQLLIDDTGVTVERYEYAPYGERTVYISPGTNDPDAHAPTLLPTRVQVSGADQPYAICDVGFQGKKHSEVCPHVRHWYRDWNTRLARWPQRDPLGYPDGMNTYAGYHVMRGTVDPSGLVPPPGPTGIWDLGGDFSTDPDFNHGPLVPPGEPFWKVTVTETDTRVAEFMHGAEIYYQVDRRRRYRPGFAGTSFGSGRYPIQTKKIEKIKCTPELARDPNFRYLREVRRDTGRVVVSRDVRRTSNVRIYDGPPILSEPDFMKLEEANPWAAVSRAPTWWERQRNKSYTGIFAEYVEQDVRIYECVCGPSHGTTVSFWNQIEATTQWIENARITRTLTIERRPLPDPSSPMALGE